MGVVFQPMLAKLRYQLELPAANDGLVVVLLQADGLEDDANLSAHATLSDLLLWNSEANFTNYGRLILTTPATVTADAETGAVAFELGEQTWTGAGGLVDNELAAIVICYLPDVALLDDTTMLPLVSLDYDTTTSGTDLTCELDFAVAGALLAVTPALNWMPTVSNVGALLRARTCDDNGNELGTFTSETRPTDTQVEELITRAASITVGASIGYLVPEPLWESARTVTSMLAAMLVEVGFFPEQVRAAASPYVQYERLFELMKDDFREAKLNLPDKLSYEVDTFLSIY